MCFGDVTVDLLDRLHQDVHQKTATISRAQRPIAKASSNTSPSVIADMIADMKQHALRLPDELAEQIDVRAAKVGLSRNAWITRALEWAIQQPAKTVTIKQEV